MGTFSISHYDYDKENTNTQFPVATLTAANFDAQGVLATALRAGIAGIVLGNLAHYEQIQNFEVSGVASDNPLAARELKWKVEFHTTVEGDPYTLTLGCPDQTKLDPNNRKYADLDEADVAAFVTAFEDYVRVDGTKLVTVDRITLVGRNI